MAEQLWRWEEIRGALEQPVDRAGGLPAVTGVSIDSRTLEPGALFVAIRGDRTDGHKFVHAALEKGAAGGVVSRDFAPDPSIPERRLVRVADPLEALNALARVSRKRSGAKIAAVTGSVGKTGTKEMLRAMLATAGQVHASEKSYNNLWGVPLSLARMPASARFGVFEIGMNHAGEITPLTQLVRPNIAIITWVAPVHIEFFESTAAIADAKAEIFEGLEAGGIAVLPADNEHFGRLAAHAKRKGASVIAFGEGASAEARLIAFEPSGSGSRITARILGEEINFTLGVPGRHLANNAVAALVAAKLLGAELQAAASALAHFQAPEGRGRQQRFETSEGPVLLIDETYNANPASMRAALQVLGSTSRSDFSRRVAVLGDMLELGHGGPEFHAGLASAIDTGAIDLVFCAGPLMVHLFERLPLHKRGALADTSEALTPKVLETVRGGDAVMIKGSLGSKMGPLADALRLHLGELIRNGQGRNAA